MPGASVQPNAAEGLKRFIREVPDFPKPGILFYDITTLLKLGPQFQQLIDMLAAQYQNQQIGLVAGIEARGFIFGPALAYRLGAGFLPIRKPRKLPSVTVSAKYSLEYGTDTLELHRDAVQPGERVLIVDDLIATGGTAYAGIKLLERAGANVIGCSFVIDLPALGGAGKLRAMGKKVHALVAFEGH